MDFAERLLIKILQDELDEKPDTLSEAARLFENQQSRRVELHLHNLMNGLNTGQFKPYQVVQIAMAVIERMPLERRTQVRKTPIDERYLTFSFHKPSEVQGATPEEEDLFAFYRECCSQDGGRRRPLSDKLFVVDAGLKNGEIRRLYLVTRRKDTRILRKDLAHLARGNKAQKKKAIKALSTTFWSDQAEDTTTFLKNRLIQDLTSRNDPEAQAEYRKILQMDLGPRANAISKMQFALQQSHLQSLPGLRGMSFEEIGNRFEKMASILLKKTNNDLFAIKDEIFEKFEETAQEVKVPLVTLNSVAMVFVAALASWQTSDFPDEDVRFKRIPNKWARERKWRNTRIPTN